MKFNDLVETPGKLAICSITGFSRVVRNVQTLANGTDFAYDAAGLERLSVGAVSNARQ